MPFDRVTTGTTRVVEFLEGSLEGPKAGTGLFKKLGVDGYNKDNGNKFVRIDNPRPKGNIIKTEKASYDKMKEVIDDKNSNN